MEVDGFAAHVDVDGAASTADPGGIWIHKETRERLGGSDGIIHLTVVG